MNEIPEKLYIEITEYGHQQYLAGLEIGLGVAERIRGWLTRQPDRIWQREVREWADQAILEARKMKEK